MADLYFWTLLLMTVSGSGTQAQLISLQTEKTICPGTQNTSSSLQKCEKASIKLDLPAQCQLPKIPGSCFDEFHHFYYNSTSGDCEKFIYTGCQGNKNNFKTLSECEKTCKISNRTTKQSPKSSGAPINSNNTIDNTTTTNTTTNTTTTTTTNSTFNATLENDIPDNPSQKTNIPPVSCSLAASKGDCNDVIERYFHDLTDGQCKRFNYSGCGGNSNRYSTKEDCEAACHDPCMLSVSTISCHESNSSGKFYYNQTIDACQRFAAGTCNSNSSNSSNSSSNSSSSNSSSNGFYSQEQCEHRCVKDVCNFQPVPSKNGSEKIYYDSKTRSCKEFDEGCRGNGNCFATVKDCQNKCMPKDPKCTLPKEQGRPCNHTTNTSYFYYDVKNKQCKKYNEGKCASTTNNFLTHRQCSWTCEENICVREWIPSFCNTSHSRHFYNLTTRECEICHNASCCGNSFESKDQCQSKCLLKDICTIPVSRDSCNGSEPRWYFEIKTGRCEEFSHGGCEGNDNHFLSEASCKKACIRNPCQSPKHPETCESPQQSYYYDSKAGMCLLSNSTCHDDGNHFLSVELCEKTCIVGNPCLTPVQEKSCQPAQTRYYYDNGSGECTRFEFKGCDGNANNYESLEECNAACKDQHEKPTAGIKQNKTVNSTGDAMKQGNTSTESVENKPSQKQQLIDDGSTLDRLANSDFNPKLQNDQPMEDDVYKNADPKQNGYRCILPLKVGSCNKTLRRFYFDSNTRTCRRFTYSGCQGNTNNFLTKKQCVRACVAICYDPFEVTPCNMTATHYHYNSITGMCEQSVCSGILNKFNELDTCERICVIDLCMQRKKPGPCRGSYPRLYYDTKTGRCLPFVYGGCHQNQNNFLTEEDCQRRCVPSNRCSLQDYVNICSISPNADRFYFDAVSGECRPTNINLCNSRANNFKSLRECESQCKPLDPCISPEETDMSCREDSMFTRYYYSKAKGICEKHLTCTTDGFESLSSCEGVCPVNICTLPSEHGTCNLDLLRYYYSPESKECNLFIYGGCQGNKNNFKTLKECVSKCQVETCSETNKTDSCGQRFERYFYDSRTNSCLPLTKKGCGDNYNNFPTLSACQNFCGKHNCQIFLNMSTTCNACQLKPEPKDCADLSERLQFYYNSSFGRCLKYETDKCGSPDGNSFSSLDDCEKTCDVNVCQLSPLSTYCYGTRDGHFYYDAETDTCKSFDKGFCAANLNGFSDVRQCERKCVRNMCHLSKDTGPCKENQERLFYNHLTGYCELFNFGGCNGNENNFLTRKKCEKRCVKDPCKLSRESGLCKAYIPRYYYNSKIDECQEFIYGGCGGNENRFETIEACQKTCQKDPCNLSPDTGHCLAYFQKYYYDITIGKCKEFIYGGCGGNKNNFETIEACEEKCQPDPCNLPPDAGPCEAVHHRFYYDISLGKCREFIYGGCEGNKNNFKTIKDCQQLCIKDPCKLPKETGPCKAYMPHYYYNSNTGQCNQFIYGGCGGNENRFERIEACEEKCQPDPCNLPPDAGPCEAVHHRFYYDISLGKCREFIYGGCEGNKNNFKTIKDCQQLCIKDPCKLPKETGPCKAYMPHYYYNSNTGQCNQFIYGGCGGNENRFERIEACEEKCQPDPCNLPPDAGPCEAVHHRFYYDISLGKCRKFIYGGCEGNKNNFKTIKDCQQICMKDPCEQPRKAGPCKARIERFYFNSMTGKCESFHYGGCEANRNNFQTIKECQKRCSSNPCSLRPDAGTCHNKSRHFYFDLETGSCLDFNYNGCGGNANRFVSVKQCEQVCIRHRCEQDMDPGVCDKNLTRFFYDFRRDQCVSFLYGGCGGNSNNFKSAQLCRDSCHRESPCLLPLMPGPCSAILLRYYYDSSEKRCLEFTYGGCHGNRNNFKTLSECKRKCAASGVKSIAKCHLPRDRGHCQSPEERFYYNHTLESCKPFNYNGCAGNANNFLSKIHCDRECKFDPCKQPMMVGDCFGREKRWFFDETSQLCLPFDYSGCGGSDNNFHSIEQCEQLCVKSTCRMEKAAGYCSQNLPRFYYNWRHGRCYRFNYTGCNGNENRFTSMKMCQETCAVDPCLQPLSIIGQCPQQTKYFYNREFGICQAFIFTGCKPNGNLFSSAKECHKSCRHMFEIDYAR